MAARENYYIAATAEATTTATAGINAATLSFTPTDNQSYLILWSALVRSATGVTIDAQILLTNNATATIAAYNIEPQDVTTYRPVGGIAFATFATATGTHNFRVKLRSETATGIQNIKDVNLAAVVLSTGDFFVNATATVDNLATTYANAATLSFTPSASGDYLILSSAERLGNNPSAPYTNMLLSINGTGTHYGSATMTQQDITNFTPFFTGVKISWTASECQTAIQYRLSSTATVNAARFRRIAAIRLDAFENNFYAEDRTTVLVTGTSTTAGNTSASLSFAPVATGNHLVIFGGMTQPISAVIDGLTQFSGTNIPTLLANQEPQLSPDENQFWGIKRWDATGTATRTWVIGHGLETTATAGTYNKKENWIACLQLDAATTATAAGAASRIYNLATTGVGYAVAAAAVLPHIPWTGGRRWAA